MTSLTPVQLERLRNRPQKTQLYLSIFQPVVIFKARINDSDIAKGARVIPFDTVSVGSWTDIQADQTMWVGSSNGAQDLGKIRVRSATSSEITVSENSNIEWENNGYLTVYKYWELWPVYPRIIPDPANEENVIFYKDYDIPYTNQNSILGTFVNMGPHRAALLDSASGEALLYYSAQGTYNLLGDSLTYHWTFEGGSPSTSTSSVPGDVTYDTPGHYVTQLIVSGSNGASDRSYRYVSIYDHPPIQKWQMNSLNGSRSEGGYSASFRVFENIPIQEHAVVVIFGENWYGDINTNLGGNAPRSGNIFWVGYVDTDSIQYDYLHSEITFDAHSITGMMKESSGFSVSVESKGSPTKWYELLDLDCRRAIYHYLRWHTTAMLIADFEFMGNDWPIQFFDSDRESMYDALDNLMGGTLLGQVVADRQSKIWAEVEAQAYPNPTGSFPSLMDITRRDWMNEPSVTERLSEEVSFLELGGIAFQGNASGTFSALIGSAPGNAPGFHGSMETQEGLALQNQNQLNTMVGNVFANMNSPFPEIDMELAINAANLDIAPQEGVGIHIAADDTIRNLEIDGLYLPEGMDWTYTPQDLILLTSVNFKELVNGVVGETVEVLPPNDIGPGFNQPPIEIPPIPPFVIPGIIIPSGTISQIINSAEQPYASYYYAGGVTNSSSRRMQITGISLSSTTSFVQFIAQDAGMYQVSVSGFGQCTGAVPGATITITINVSIGGIWSFSATGYTTIPTSGVVGVTCATSRAVYLQGNGNITFQITISNDGGGTQSSASNPEYLVLSAIRISA